ncbi:hypothetical protein [Paraburkholderia sediminicola]|uniref:hypothetical protein n=1 Tax=Paraburkholderia sediminicola TaxID=458836 RepID=UPI0038BB7664
MSAEIIQFPASSDRPAPQTVEDLKPEETTPTKQGGCMENSIFQRQYAICEDFI